MFEGSLTKTADILNESTDTRDRGFKRETIWFNPTDKDIILSLHQGSVPTFPNKPDSIQRTGIVKYRIKAKESAAIPSDFDMGIQQYHCKEHECASRALYCKDPTHDKDIVGGYGIHLVNKGYQKRPTLHSALDDNRARFEKVHADAREAQLVMANAQADVMKAKDELALIQKQIEEARAQSASAQFVPPPKN
jgi:hypothetical protein